MYKKQYFFVITSFLFFIIIALFLIIQDNLKIDAYVYNMIKPCISPFMTNVFKIITWFGSGIGIIIFTTIFLFLLKNNRYKIAMLINLVSSILLNQGLKHIFMRERPKELFLIEETGFSFPSGHSSIAIAFYGFLIYIVWKKFQNKKLKYIFITILSSLILLIGISRIYLGVHYFTDVIGGYFITLAHLILFITILEKKSFFKEFDNNK